MLYGKIFTVKALTSFQGLAFYYLISLSTVDRSRNAMKSDHICAFCAFLSLRNCYTIHLVSAFVGIHSSFAYLYQECYGWLKNSSLWLYYQQTPHNNDIMYCAQHKKKTFSTENHPKRFAFRMFYDNWVSNRITYSGIYLNTLRKERLGM